MVFGVLWGVGVSVSSSSSEEEEEEEEMVEGWWREGLEEGGLGGGLKKSLQPD